MALVLSRRVNEAIIIDGDIEVRIIQILGGQVRVSISAPDDVEIWREEIWERMSKEDKDVDRTGIDD